MNTDPLRQYILAVKSYEAGNKDAALAQLTESMGAEQPTPMMRDSLGKLLDVSPAALAIILHRSK